MTACIPVPLAEDEDGAGDGTVPGADDEGDGTADDGIDGTAEDLDAAAGLVVAVGWSKASVAPTPTPAASKATPRWLRTPPRPRLGGGGGGGYMAKPGPPGLPP
jgi:hypothetical protein